MNELSFALLDNGRNFTIISDTNEYDIEYGAFALALINTDYQQIHQYLETTLKNNHYLQLAEEIQYIGNRTHHIGLGIADLIFRDTLEPLSGIIQTDYLNPMQSIAVAELLLHEIKQHITHTTIHLDDIETYIPPIYSNKDLHKHIRESLLRKTTVFSRQIQNELNNVEITSSVMVLDDGTPCTVYYLQDTLSYLILDMQKYLQSKKQVIECEHCKRLFYPRYRITERYCRLPHSNTKLTCNEIRHREVNNDFAKLRNKARGYQHQRCFNPYTQEKYENTPNFLTDTYADWSVDCSTNYEYYMENDDRDGFEKWVTETKFTAERLEELHKEYIKK